MTAEEEEEKEDGDDDDDDEEEEEDDEDEEEEDGAEGLTGREGNAPIPKLLLNQRRRLDLMPLPNPTLLPPLSESCLGLSRRR